MTATSLRRSPEARRRDRTRASHAACPLCTQRLTPDNPAQPAHGGCCLDCAEAWPCCDCHQPTTTAWAALDDNQRCARCASLLGHRQPRARHTAQDRAETRWLAGARWPCESPTTTPGAPDAQPPAPPASDTALSQREATEAPESLGATRG